MVLNAPFQIELTSGPFEVTAVSLEVASLSSITSVELIFTLDGSYTDLLSSTKVRLVYLPNGEKKEAR